jgi:hypothetical protein
VLAFLIFSCGFVLIYLGKQAHHQSEDEKFYAQGYTKEQLIEKKRKEKERAESIAWEVGRKDRENEALARAIAKELKK